MSGQELSSYAALTYARTLAKYAESLGYAVAEDEAPTSGWHLGAILADAVLQTGLNYTSVVMPRIARIVEVFPESETVSGLNGLLKRISVPDYLSWQHYEKVERFGAVLSAVCDASVDNVSELRQWAMSPSGTESLLAIRGVGPKTVDYLYALLGVDSVAVDRHVRRFAQKAGVFIDDYHGLRTIVCYAADLLGGSRRLFDHWIWRLMSGAGSYVNPLAQEADSTSDRSERVSALSRSLIPG